MIASIHIPDFDHSQSPALQTGTAHLIHVLPVHNSIYAHRLKFTTIILPHQDITSFSWLRTKNTIICYCNNSYMQTDLL